MHTGLRTGLAAALATMTVMAASGARAATVYLGLPSGASIAYTRSSANAKWKRDRPADLPSVRSHAIPTLADLDGDGDRDALVGDGEGGVRAYENTGSDASPLWSAHPAWDPPFDFGHYPAPALGDVDGDGDADLLVGTSAGEVRAIENVGDPHAPVWRERSTWKLRALGNDPHPSVDDVDGDGRSDLLVGLRPGTVLAFTGTGNAVAPFARAAAWDPPVVGARVAIALGDLDGDGRPDLLVTDGNARSRAFRNTGGTWAAAARSWSPRDPGSGPAAPAIVVARPPSDAASPHPTNAAPTARLTVSPGFGPSPLTVTFDASRSRDPDRDRLALSWNFGDGTAADSAGARPTHVYAAPGRYVATVAVADASHVATATTTIVVVAPPVPPRTPPARCRIHK
jgi:hypothetical protein